MAFSEDTKVSCSALTQERIMRVVDVAKTIVHYGWVPFVLYVGFMSSFPRPNLFKCAQYQTNQDAQPALVALC